MATTLEFIAQVLEKNGAGYEFDKTNGCIWVLGRTKDLELPIGCYLREEGHLLDILAAKILVVKDHAHQLEVCETLLSISRELALIRFEYHRATGAISASIQLPLLDVPLTETTFIWCLQKLIGFIGESMPRLRCVLSTGRDPGPKSYLEQIVEKMSEAERAQLAQLLANQQQ